MQVSAWGLQKHILSYKTSENESIYVRVLKGSLTRCYLQPLKWFISILLLIKAIFFFIFSDTKQLELKKFLQTEKK